MKRIGIIILLLCLLPMGACAAGIKQVISPNDVSMHYLFDKACEFSVHECKGIPKPFLVVTDTGRTLGFYVHGMNVVFLSSECHSRMADKTLCHAVAIHEIVHYIDWFTNSFPTDTNGCLTEARAWATYNNYVVAERRRDLYRDKWWKEYKQCGPSQSDSVSSATASP